MEGKIRALVLTTKPTEFQLITSVLSDCDFGFETKNARNESEFLKLLNRYKPEVIISFSEIANFQVEEIMLFLNNNDFQIPFILISGKITDELYKKYDKLGIDEFIHNHNLLLLPSTIIKSIAARKIILVKDAAVQQSKSTEAKLNSFYENNPEIIFEIGFNGEFINMNSSASQLISSCKTSKPLVKKNKLTNFLSGSESKLFKDAHSSVCRGKHNTLSLNFLNKKKEEIIVEFKLSPIFDDAQIITSVLLIGIDVTEKVIVQRELTLSKVNFSNLSNSIDEAMWSVDTEFKIVDFNERAAEQFSIIRRKKLVKGMSLSDFSADEERLLRWESRYKKALLGEKNSDEDFFSMNDIIKYSQIISYPIIIDNSIIGVSVLARDITSQKLADDNLKKSESKYKALYEELASKQLLLNAIESTSKISFWTREMTDDYPGEWSDDTYTIFERNKSQGPLTFSEMISCIHPGDREKYLSQFHQIKKNGVMNLEYRIVAPSGKIKYLQTTAYPLLDEKNNLIRISGIRIDLTELRKIEEEAFNQQQFLQTAMKIANTGLWEYNVLEKTTIWSKETKKMMGLKSDEAPLSMEVYLALVHPEDREKLKDFFRKQIHKKEPSSQEYRIYINGFLHTQLTFSRPIINKSNEVEKISGVIIDLTNHKTTESKLRASEKLFNSFFENSSDAIFIEDEEGNILNVNKSACEMQGQSKEELIGKNISDLIPENEQSEILKEYKNLFANQKGKFISKTWKISGEVQNVEINALKITYKDTPALLLNVKQLNS